MKYAEYGKITSNRVISPPSSYGCNCVNLVAHRNSLARLTCVMVNLLIKILKQFSDFANNLISIGFGSYFIEVNKFCNQLSSEIAGYLFWCSSRGLHEETGFLS